MPDRKGPLLHSRTCRTSSTVPEQIDELRGRSGGNASKLKLSKRNRQMTVRAGDLEPKIRCNGFGLLQCCCICSKEIWQPGWLFKGDKPLFELAATCLLLGREMAVLLVFEEYDFTGNSTVENQTFLIGSKCVHCGAAVLAYSLAELLQREERHRMQCAEACRVSCLRF